MSMSATLVVLVMSLLLLFWRWQHRPWKVLSVIDSDPRIEIDQLLFLDERRGLAFGHSEPEAVDTMRDVNGRLRAETAWVYATDDGGLHWQARKPLGRGHVVDFNKIPGGAILLVQRHLDESDNWKAYLQISEDDGATWSSVEAGWEVVGRQFVDDARGFLWGNGPVARWMIPDRGEVIQEGSLLYYTDDHAASWERVEVPPDVSLRIYRPALHPDGSLFYLHQNKLIHLTRQPDRRWREQIDELPSSLTAWMVQADTYGGSTTVWIIAHEPPKEDEPDIVQAHLLRRDGPGKIEAVSGLSFPQGFMADAMFVHDVVVTIIGADYSGASFIAPVTLFRSEDGGKSWRSEKPAIRSQARPVAFWGPRHIWAVGTGNRLQHRQ